MSQKEQKALLTAEEKGELYRKAIITAERIMDGNVPNVDVSVTAMLNAARFIAEECTRENKLNAFAGEANDILGKLVDSLT